MASERSAVFSGSRISAGVFQVAQHFLEKLSLSAPFHVTIVRDGRLKIRGVFFGRQTPKGDDRTAVGSLILITYVRTGLLHNLSFKRGGLWCWPLVLLARLGSRFRIPSLGIEGASQAGPISNNGLTAVLEESFRRFGPPSSRDPPFERNDRA